MLNKWCIPIYVFPFMYCIIKIRNRIRANLATAVIATTLGKMEKAYMSKVILHVGRYLFYYEVYFIKNFLLMHIDCIKVARSKEKGTIIYFD